jgi:hypothetical protein
MSSHSMVIGSIDGISEADFKRLRSELEQCFEKVVWKNKRLIIKSDGEHRDLKKVFQTLADHVRPGHFGSMLYVGKGTVACFYFGHKQVIGKKFIEPDPPAWWNDNPEVTENPINTDGYN